MGVDHKAILMYGAYFDDIDSVDKFVKETHPDSTVDYEGATGTLALNNLIVESLNMYTGVGYILGIHIPPGYSYEDAKAEWDEIFYKHIKAAKIHLKVVTW